ncbi:bifunctional diguanylate cyclase/phosphodiesterase [Vibrio stylophorae]|nr:bifunctional diguanylate cyclase/phosphodiesterase [Vibrio stylophorae]
MLQRYQSEIIVALILVALFSIVIAVLVTMVTRLKTSQQKLKHNKALFNGIFEQSFQFILILDKEGRIESYNTASQHFFQVNGKPLFWDLTLWPANAQRQILAQFHFAQDQNSGYCEILAYHPHRGECVIELGIRQLPPVENEPPFYMVEARDVSTRRHMESRIRQSEANYRMLYDQQPVMLMTLDRNSLIVSINQYAASRLGYQPHELVGKDITDFYLNDHQTIEQFFQRTAKNGVSDKRQVRFQSAHGTSVWVSENARFDENNQQYLLVGEDITAHKNLTEQLIRHAHHDPLTGLFNRNHFEQQLSLTLDNARRNQQLFALLYIDLDQFKMINELAGHNAGDQALKQAASVMSQQAPPNALLARLSGDEFAIILRQCTAQDAINLGNKIIAALSENPFYWHDNPFKVGCSIGIRMIDERCVSAQQVHAHADTACHIAKREGRNRIHIYHGEDEELKRHEKELEVISQIRHALLNECFELYAQPICAINDPQAKTRYEILLRMFDANGQMISPGLFIPIAERYSMAHEIDRFVIQSTIDLLEQYPQWVAQMGGISLNLSGQSLSHRDLIDELIESINNSSVANQLFSLEITETAAIDNLDNAIHLFTELHNLGCRIALDDFGSGLSSFGYLKQLPVDIIKIDGMFVRDIAESQADFAMVKAIHQLARELGKMTIAEFVENQAGLEKLAEIGVDYAQGYHLGRPEPLRQLIERSEKAHAH